MREFVDQRWLSVLAGIGVFDHLPFSLRAPPAGPVLQRQFLHSIGPLSSHAFANPGFGLRHVFPVLWPRLLQQALGARLPILSLEEFGCRSLVVPSDPSRTSCSRHLHRWAELVVSLLVAPAPALVRERASVGLHTQSPVQTRLVEQCLVAECPWNFFFFHSLIQPPHIFPTVWNLPNLVEYRGWKSSK